MEAYWFEEAPAKNRFPVFTGSLEVDVAIVGGGIAGLTAAYFLAKSGLRIALFEQNFIASGESGYTTALLSHHLDNALDTRKTWTATQDALETIEKIAREERISCDFKRMDALSFTKGDPNNLKSDYKLLLSTDSSLQFLEKKDAVGKTGFDVEAAMIIKNQAEFHPRRYLLGLAKIVQSEGCEIFEESQVLEVKDGGKTLILKNGQVKTTVTVLATGRPLAAFGEITKLLSPYLTFVIGAEFEKGGDLRPLGDYLFWDDNISYHYFRWVSERELILGGEDRPLGGIRSGDNQFENLEKFLKSMTESKFSVRHKWQGAIFNTLDNLPYIGRHPAFGENIYFAFGFGGNGITFGTLGGKIIYDQIMGRENKFAKTFSFVRL